MPDNPDLPLPPQPLLTEANLVEKLIPWARQHLSDDVATWSDDRLRARIKSGIARARSHGFTWESSIATFVSLMLRFAPNFDRHPSAAALLQRQDIAPEERANRFFTDITAEEWAQIEQDYDSYAWADFSDDPNT